MSILVVDSGATKSCWVYASTDGCGGVCEENSVLLPGINARVASDADIVAVLSLLPTFSVDAVFFYGAGCGTVCAQQRMHGLLARFFSCPISVEGDLLGACRAACGHERGLVGILGTGSNACFYDGCVIISKLPSLGSMIGDEGSGVDIGKRLLRDYLRGTMPQPLRAHFSEMFPQSYEGWMEILYRRPEPGRQLASLVNFAVAHEQDEYVVRLVSSALGDFFEKQYVFDTKGCTDLYLVGGIASQFATLLSQIVAQKGFHLCGIVKRPINALAEYHAKEARDV